MAPKKMAGMPLEDESDNESAFYEAENRNVALTTASFELRRRQVKEFKVFPEKDEKNHVKQWRKWCRDALAELQKLKAYGGGSLANFAAQKLHLEKEKQASRTACMHGSSLMNGQMKMKKTEGPEGAGIGHRALGTSFPNRFPPAVHLPYASVTNREHVGAKFALSRWGKIAGRVVGGVRLLATQW